ncbi:hypothetical protein A6770_16800 [Nostoc minutum NIES-26]|uniref:PEP-CTERM sorting domain-containing protein n=1 Tax=Nostoc minutum NIES-26 TaxID=1844469 RepID=A0A367RGN0_9NOSO|nr:hypothetical protein [Dendronalium sp. ChiSLP03b]MDZ8207190.1 hypothetical protein [Dendronalium sp. ChiSLP03b]RCJ34724.1 hypothetical protein A6770_16800 [Nostoc minutum NIES-26]
MNKFFSTLTLTTGIALSIALTRITPAQAVTFDFGWNGNGGYSAKGSFSYDENTAPAIFAENNGLGATNILQSLNVSFFDPRNNLIAAYDNVVDGISTGQYFKFNFNTTTQEIFGSIDLGGEVAGDTYLSGTVNTNLSLYQVPQSGSDLVIDSSSGFIAIKTVPEPNSILSLVVLSAVGIMFRIK